MVSLGQNKKRVMRSWIEALQNYFKFSGRSSRYDFWAFMFVNLIMFLLWLGSVYFLKLNRIFWYVFLAYISVPLLSVATRRLHDMGRTGKWTIPAALLVSLTILDWEFSFFNLDILLYLSLSYCTFLLWLLGTEGKRFGNKYGPYVMEKNGRKTQSFLQHVNTGFLVGIWLAYFFYLFITRA